MLRSALPVVLLALCLVSVPFVAQGQEVENLVLNPSFEDENDIIDDAWIENGWVTWGDADGLASVVEMDEDDFVDGLRSARVEPVGTVDWHFMIIYYPVALDFGEPYTVSFWARAQEERTIAVHMKDVGNAGSFGDTTFTITPEWTEYHYTSDAQQRNIKLEIFVSASEVPVWFDFVYIYAGEYVEGILPSEIDVAVQPDSKLSVTWGALNLLNI